jgi:uncharacterized protein YbjT (DUF2867 family)
MRVTVIGATGAQGGSVVNALLSDEYEVRGVTRRPDSPEADRLRRQGVEVVAADLDDPESLDKAFDGAQGAFCVTNIWEHLDPARETRQAENLAAAVGRAGVEHSIWSTLGDSRLLMPLDDDRIPTLLGRYKVPHTDAKAEADHFFDETRTTFLELPFYWENLLDPRMLRRDEEGVLVLALPLGEARIPGIAVSDIGRIVRTIFARSLTGYRLRVCGDQLTAAQMAEALTDRLGEPVRYFDLPVDALRSWGFAGEDGANMFLHLRLFNEEHCAARPPETSRTLVPDLLDFATWADSLTLHWN